MQIAAFSFWPLPVSSICLKSFGPHQGEEGWSVGSRLSVHGVVLSEFEVHVLVFVAGAHVVSVSMFCFFWGWRQAVAT